MYSMCALCSSNYRISNFLMNIHTHAQCSVIYYVCILYIWVYERVTDYKQLQYEMVWCTAGVDLEFVSGEGRERGHVSETDCWVAVIHICYQLVGTPLKTTPVERERTSITYSLWWFTIRYVVYRDPCICIITTQISCTYPLYRFIKHCPLNTFQA